MNTIEKVKQWFIDRDLEKRWTVRQAVTQTQRGVR